MAIIKAINSKSGLKNIIEYITKENKTNKNIISGKDCNVNTALDEMIVTKKMWGKEKGRQYKHYIQSFSKNENITETKAHKIALELAIRHFKGFEVLLATHNDKEHIHTHMVVNSVSFETGKKYQEKKDNLQELKNKSDKICLANNLSIIERKTSSITSFNQKKYKIIEKGFAKKEKSYLLETAKEIYKCLNMSFSKDDFIENMVKSGYKVKWEDKRENIVYTTPNGKKIRSSNLAKTFKEKKFDKGEMYEFFRNKKRNRERNSNKGEHGRNIIQSARANEEARELFNSDIRQRHDTKSSNEQRDGKYKKSEQRNTGRAEKNNRRTEYNNKQSFEISRKHFEEWDREYGERKEKCYIRDEQDTEYNGARIKGDKERNQHKDEYSRGEDWELDI